MRFLPSLLLHCLPTWTALLSAFGVPAVASAQDAIQWKQGTHFTYVNRDLWGKETARWEDVVKSAGPQGFEIERQADGSFIKFAVSPQGVITRSKPKDEGTFSYSPVLLPIKEGSEWEWTFEYVTRSKGDLAKHVRKCRMGGMEDVKVPSGTYSARKVECKGTYQAGQWRGSSQTTSWWAPSISAVVKVVDVDNYTGGRDVVTTTLDAITSE